MKQVITEILHPERLAKRRQRDLKTRNIQETANSLHDRTEAHMQRSSEVRFLNDSRYHVRHFRHFSDDDYGKLSRILSKGIHAYLTLRNIFLAAVD